MGREHWIDCVKGFAIICVVMGHVRMEDYFLCNWIYSFHLPVFFMMTGILLFLDRDWESQSLWLIVKKKGVSLLWPYIMFSILCLAWPLIRGDETTIFLIIRETLCMNGYSALWFLPALFLSECTFALLHRSKIPDTISMAVLSVFSYAGSVIYHTGDGLETTPLRYVMLNMINSAVIGTVFIMVGYWFYCGIRQNEKIFGHKKMIVLYAGVFVIDLFLAQSNHLVDLHFSVMNQPVLYYLLACMGSFSLILLMKYLIKKNRVLEYFGRNSLIIMATHLPLPILYFVKRELNTGGGI